MQPLADRLEAYLSGVSGRAEVALVTLTEPDLRRTSEAGAPCPFLGRVRKRSTLRAVIGVRYADAVNERRRAEGKAPDFAPAARKGPERIGSSPLLRGKDGPLLEYLVEDVESVAYEVDGQPIRADLLRPWLKPAHDAGAGQGLDWPVVYRTVKLANIVELTARTPAGHAAAG